MELCQVAGGLAGGEVDRLEDVFVQLTSLVLRRAEPSEVVLGWRYKRNCYKLQQSLGSHQCAHGNHACKPFLHRYAKNARV